MKKRLLLIIILITGIISLITLFLILNYLDPYRNEIISILSIGITFLLFFISFVSIFLYFVKKVYYRGEIFLSHIFSSIRQAFILAFFIIGNIVFYKIGVFSFSTCFLLFLISFFMELLFENF